jgi:hypothetical protein
MTAASSARVVFDAMATPGAWGTVIRAFAPWSDKYGALEPCGTVAAYQRHNYHREMPDPLCQDAPRRAREARQAAP